jgi:parallel beta-helix repeat protein
MKAFLFLQLVMLACLGCVQSTNAAVRYVDVNSISPVPPYTNWATAATVIQHAIDAALPGDEIVVTNGVYQTGGRAVQGTLTNRVAVTKPLTVRSVNGPQVTIIRGYQVPGTTTGEGAVRCVYLTEEAALAGFTLSGGATWSRSSPSETNLGYEVLRGGGVWCESTNALVSNCILSGNAAEDAGGGASGATLNDCTLTSNIAQGGGGAFGGALNNCSLTGNVARHYGGGVYFSTLNNCTLTGNSASFGSGGGAFSATLNNCLLTGNSAESGGGANACDLNNCTLTKNSAFSGGGVEDIGWPSIGGVNNCIIYDNTATGQWANYYFSAGNINHSCTTPLPISGVGNITNAPLFVNPAAGNFRLQANSPCINAGSNAYAPAGPDLDGNPRIVGGTVDIGAYEFQSPQSTISYAWLQHYGLATDGSADSVDADGDGASNRQEWRAWTDPTNSASSLRLLTPLVSTYGLLVRWQSVRGQNYFLERGTNLGAHPVFAPLADNLFGDAGTTSYTDKNTPAPGPFFYRVGVRD